MRTRSRMMAGIKGRNTQPELIVRRFLHSKGFRFRLHDAKLPGSPDIVMPKYKLLIFVHGCFWHRHQDCCYATNPVQNSEKWKEKFNQNVKRDKQQIKELIDLGWRIVVIWECGLRSRKPDLLWLVNYLKTGDETYVEWPHNLS